MAKIGLNNFRWARLTEAVDGTPSYDGAKKPASAISCNVDISNNDAKLYADDVLAETDSSFQEGNVTIGIDDEDQATAAGMLGHTIENGEMIRNSNDVAPWVGFGRVVVRLINNVRKYKVEFLPKVKFSEPSQEDQTKGEDVEFRTYEMQGKVAQLANGDWSKTKTFDTQTEAINYLEGLLAAGGSAVTIAFDVTTNGGSGTVASVSAYAGQTIIVPDGTGITPPTNKVFAGWDTTATATTPDITGTYLVTGAATLYAIYKAAE